MCGGEVIGESDDGCQGNGKNCRDDETSAASSQVALAIAKVVSGEELRLMARKIKAEQADDRRGRHRGSYHCFLKRYKRRYERHKAKLDPETPATFGKYRGWES